MLKQFLLLHKWTSLDPTGTFHNMQLKSHHVHHDICAHCTLKGKYEKQKKKNLKSAYLYFICLLLASHWCWGVVRHTCPSISSGASRKGTRSNWDISCIGVRPLKCRWQRRSQFPTLGTVLDNERLQNHRLKGGPKKMSSFKICLLVFSPKPV